MEPYKATASEFSNAGKSDDDQSQLVDVESDVDSLKSKLSNLTDQQSLAKGIKDTQNVSIFRADFRPLKRTILPNISKTIIQLQDSLPKLGREKMENFNEDCKSLKDIIDFEFKTGINIFHKNRNFSGIDSKILKLFRIRKKKFLKTDFSRLSLLYSFTKASVKKIMPKIYSFY